MHISHYFLIDLGIDDDGYDLVRAIIGTCADCTMRVLSRVSVITVFRPIQHYSKKRLVRQQALGRAGIECCKHESPRNIKYAFADVRSAIPFHSARMTTS